jgi:hypothetical protein
MNKNREEEEWTEMNCEREGSTIWWVEEGESNSREKRERGR